MKPVIRRHSASRSREMGKAKQQNLSKKPSVPSSPPTELEIRGTTVHFPFRPYKCQEEYMAKVLEALHHGENALLESPTGTGKTLCLLCSTLAWQREQACSIKKRNSNEDHNILSSQLEGLKAVTRSPTIIYASRTHSQLSQVMRELKNTRYRPKHALLGSREQMCVHPKVKTETSTIADINHECNRLGKNRKCRFRNNLEGFSPEPNELGVNPGVQPVMDMEDLVTMGKTRKVCPFYYTRSLAEDADLILVPYNYLFDKQARETTLSDVQWKNSIVIFDEAHNLESFASESASFDLTSVDIASCIAEVHRVLGYQHSMPEISERISGDNLIKLKAVFLELENYISNLDNDRNVFTGEYMMKIFLEGGRINHLNYVMFINEAKKVSEILMDLRSNSGSKGQTKIDYFIGCVKCVFGETTEARCLAKAASYRVHISSGNAKTISYWCFAPSLAMEELANLNIRSIIVTSGTLSPLPSYSMELGIPFPHTLENPHIIADEQLYVRVIGHGVSGKHLSSAYIRRDDAEYLSELGNTIVNLARVVPDGMLVFFPSYTVMNKCIEHWGGPAPRQNNFANKGKNKSFFTAKRKHSKSASQFSFPYAPDYYGMLSSNQNSTWKRLLSQKSIILEPKSTAELTDAISDFQKFLNQPKSTGCILMGVCRGKISEGIDFAHEMCRAVVITGLPFPPFVDPKVKLKREYLDGIRTKQRAKATGEGGFGHSVGSENMKFTTLSGMEWYTQQAHRAVNQAIGRVIRNKYDYGAVLLLDSRFGEPNNRKGLSKWVGTRLLPDDKFGIAVSGLAKFYHLAKSKVSNLRTLDTSVPATSLKRLGILLSYENDSKSDSDEILSKKIAIVKDTANQSQSESISGLAECDKIETGYIPQHQIVARMNLEDQTFSRDIKKKEIGFPKPGLVDIYKATSTTGLSSNNSVKNISRKTARSLDNENTRVYKQYSSMPTIIDKKPSKSTSAAQLFFHTAKKNLSADDFLSLRKLSIQMKKCGDSNDTAAYLKTTGSLVDILIKNDDIEKRDSDSESTLVSLLLPLLPKTRRKEVQILTIKKILKRSAFLKQCHALLPKNQHAHAHRIIFHPLKLLYCVPLDKPFSKTSFIEGCTPLVKYFFERGLHRKRKGCTEGISLLDSFSRLLPNKLRIVIQAILDDITAAKKKKLEKAREKSLEGEDGIDKARFSEIKKEAQVNQDAAITTDNKESEHDKELMEGAIIISNTMNAAKRARVHADLESVRKKKNQSTLQNPYQSASKIVSQSTEKKTYKASAKNPYKSKARKIHQSIYKSASTVQSLNSPAQLTLQPSFPKVSLVEKPVAKITSSSSTKSQCQLNQNRKRKGTSCGEANVENEDRVMKILMNAGSKVFKGKQSPKLGVKANGNGFSCRICHSNCMKPYIAACGHLACGECWIKWLAKSFTCPVCRGPTTKGELSRVIYEDKASSGVLSISKLYDANSDTDSDGLEIIK